MNQENRQVDVPIIPREVLFGNPDKASVRLSPDGSRIGFLAPVDGVLNVWVGPAADPESAKPVTHDKVRGIRIFFWAYTNQHILYLQDKGGDENWRVYAVDLATNEAKDLTPFEDTAARIQDVSKDYPEEILVGLNNRDAKYHDIHRVNIRTGERSLLQENPDFAGFITDDDYTVRFAARMTDDGGVEVLKPTDKGDWQPYRKELMEDTLTTSHAGFDETGKVEYRIDSRGRDTAALIAVDLETDGETILAEDPRTDVSGVMRHPTEKHPQAVAFTYERQRWQILDPDIEDDFEHLETVADGDFSVVSRTLDDRHWIVLYVTDDGPVRYYHYDRSAVDARFLFTGRKDLEGLPLAKMHPAVIKSRDGLDLVCYYTLPVWSDPGGRGTPENPLPMVVYPHGGPWGRDHWGYNPTHQWLANRGYAVLSVNFRGSTGFGKGFINASTKEWGRRMHDDLIDAVEWAVKEGIADPKKVAIMGGSYGGYATLVGLTFTPDTFACGVDIVGPSNIVTLLQTIPPYWAPTIELWAARVGDHRTEQGRALLTERSPLTHVDRIRKPLLIGQGANDPRVKQSESDQIVAAMQEKNIPVTYVLYPDEGHGFARPENRQSFNAVAEAFLARCLGGRFEPIGSDFEGASITVPVGAEHVPGLEEQLVRRTANSRTRSPSRLGDTSFL